jgi:hypothetical protein
MTSCRLSRPKPLMADVARKRRYALIGDYRIARVQKYQTQIAIGERSSVVHGNEDEAFWTEFRGWPEAESGTQGATTVNG